MMATKAEKKAGHYIAKEMRAGAPREQAVAIGLREAGVPKKKDKPASKGGIPNDKKGGLHNSPGGPMDMMQGFSEACAAAMAEHGE